MSNTNNTPINHLLFFSSPGYGETKIPPPIGDSTPMVAVLKHLSQLIEKAKSGTITNPQPTPEGTAS